MRLTTTLSKIVYWLTWPLAFIVLRGSQRTRILLKSDDQVLVVRGWVSDGRWGIPGGGIHKNEEPPVGVIRELKEETGIVLNPTQLNFLGTKSRNEHGISFFNHYFYVAVGEPLVAKPQFEIKELKWIDYHELNIENATPDVLAALELVGLS